MVPAAIKTDPTWGCSTTATVIGNIRK